MVTMFVITVGSGVDTLTNIADILIYIDRVALTKSHLDNYHNQINKQ